MMYENGIDAFREQQREEAIERHEMRLQQDREQRERTEAEKAAAALPIREEMRQLTAKAKADLWKLQPGDIYAVQTLCRCTLDALTVLQYVFSLTDPAAAAADPGQEQAAGGAQE